METDKLSADWHALAERVSVTLCEHEDLPEEGESCPEFFELAALEQKIVARSGGPDLARLKIEIALNYAKISGDSDDPAWQIIKSALDDLGESGRPIKLETAA